MKTLKSKFRKFLVWIPIIGFLYVQFDAISGRPQSLIYSGSLRTIILNGLYHGFYIGVVIMIIL